MKSIERAVVMLAALFTTREAAAACMGRPTDANGVNGYIYPPGAASSYATDRTRIHWATSGIHVPVLATSRPDGVPDTVALAGDLAEQALTAYAGWGYRTVPSDMGCPSNGGDEKLDIYLVSFSASFGADGTTLPECTGGTCSSFVLVESTFALKAYATPAQGFQTVVTHELFHTVQNTYKTDDAGFWAEGTAQWAMKTVHPDLPDFEKQLPAFFSQSARSLDAPPSGATAGYLYGAAVWPLFLSLRHQPETIRQIFETEAAGQEVLAATDTVLQTKGSSLAADFPMFAAWNAATGALAGTGGYPDAAKYPGTAVADLADGVAGITSGLSYFAFRGTLDGPRHVALDTDATRNGGVLVPIADGKPDLAQAAPLPADGTGDVLVVVAGTTTKKTDAPFTIQLVATAPPATAAATTKDDGGCRAAPSGGHTDGWVAALGLLFAVRRRRAS